MYKLQSSGAMWEHWQCTIAAKHLDRLCYTVYQILMAGTKTTKSCPFFNGAHFAITTRRCTKTLK